MADTCYMCNRPSVSREHVPPLCFFPELIDTQQNIDFRKNLITVPSCDKHNTEKSNDDVYVFALICMHCENNDVATSHALTKVKRAFKKDKGLARKIAASSIPICYNNQKTFACKIDLPKYYNATGCMVRALYYHHYHEKLLYQLHVHSPGIRDASLNKRKDIREFVTMIDPIFARCSEQGENKEVFKYKLYRDDQKMMAIKMTFYEGCDIVALSADRLINGI